MARTRWMTVPLTVLLFGAAACGAGENPDEARTSGKPAAAAPAAPSAGDAEFAQLTANWSDQAMETCATALRDVLGTRDLVQGALDGVKDPDGKATSEIADARHWMGEAARQYEEVHPQLEAGACDGEVKIALDQAWQYYVKAGTAAVQASQIVGS